MKKQNNKTIVYQAKSGAIELKQDGASETVWATQMDIASIFDVGRPAITKHIRNILKDKELDVTSVCSKMEHTGSDGKKYEVQFYNLDVILSVGYRINSNKAIAFRQWATKTLKQHILKGYTLNRHRIKTNYEQFIKASKTLKAYCQQGQYFIVKNHPFLDGNKRSGAYAFVWFLRKVKMLDITKITPPALTAITLLIAESSPKDKEKMVGLVCSFLGKH